MDSYARVVAVRSTTLVLLSCLAMGACGGGNVPAAEEGAWVGNVSVDGNITTVVNEAGSVWGGPATLVEKMSIGVETGSPEYMLGSIGGLWATDDEIYVIDRQLPALRVYDYEGRHLRDIGRRGQGPGEFMQPLGVFVDGGGRIYVNEYSGNARVNVYSADGEHIDTWTDGETGRLFLGVMMAQDGTFFSSVTITIDPMDPNTWERGMQQVGAEGAIGEIIPRPVLHVDRLQIKVTRGEFTSDRSVPYSPSQISAFSPTGAWITGVNDAYHFEIHHPGGEVTRVERYWDPVPIEADEAAYRKRWTTDSIRRSSPNFQWNGPEIPDHKPAYYMFVPTNGDMVMVVRELASYRVEDCDELYADRGSSTELCYQPNRAWDMFDLEGNYLGGLKRPEGRLYSPYLRGNLMLLHVEDELGTIMVKRFELTPPSAGSQ